MLDLCFKLDKCSGLLSVAGGITCWMWHSVLKDHWTRGNCPFCTQRNHLPWPFQKGSVAFSWDGLELQHCLCKELWFLDIGGLLFILRLQGISHPFARHTSKLQEPVCPCSQEPIIKFSGIMILLLTQPLLISLCKDSQKDYGKYKVINA